MDEGRLGGGWKKWMGEDWEGVEEVGGGLGRSGWGEIGRGESRMCRLIRSAISHTQRTHTLTQEVLEKALQEAEKTHKAKLEEAMQVCLLVACVCTSDSCSMSSLSSLSLPPFLFSPPYAPSSLRLSVRPRRRQLKQPWRLKDRTRLNKSRK